MLSCNSYNNRNNIFYNLYSKKLLLYVRNIPFKRIRNLIVCTGRKCRLREKISVKQALEPNQCLSSTDADEMRVGSFLVAQCNYLLKKKTQSECKSVAAARSTRRFQDFQLLTPSRP